MKPKRPVWRQTNMSASAPKNVPYFAITMIVTVGLAVTACASRSPSVSSLSVPSAAPPSGQAPSSGQVPQSASPLADPAANKRKADQEALRLLSLAQVPPGGVELTAPPTALPGPVMGSSATSSLIDHARYWRVPMPFAAAAAWVKAHPPVGLTSGGSESGTTHGVLDNVGYTYGEPDTDAWVEAQYEVAVAPDGTAASEIRIDGTDNWLDPVPQRDGATGKRLSVTVARGCPQSDDGYEGVSNTGPGLDTELLPSGRPTAGLICLYDGMNGKPFGLIATKPLDGAAATRLAAVVAKISLSHLDGAIYNCPMGDGVAAIVAFSYPGRADVDLWYARNGCQSLANGHISGAPDDAFYGAVQSVVPALGSPLPRAS